MATVSTNYRCPLCGGEVNYKTKGDYDYKCSKCDNVYTEEALENWECQVKCEQCGEQILFTDDIVVHNPDKDNPDKHFYDSNDDKMFCSEDCRKAYIDEQSAEDGEQFELMQEANYGRA